MAEEQSASAWEEALSLDREPDPFPQPIKPSERQKTATDVNGDAKVTSPMVTRPGGPADRVHGPRCTAVLRLGGCATNDTPAG